MARKQKKQPEGAPLWVVSYGDMMSLLLTFFIMIASLANFEEIDDRFMAAIESIRQAMGMRGQSGKAMEPTVDFHSLIVRLESVVKPIEPKKRGHSDERGVQGKNLRLRRIRDGAEITIGGPVIFEPFEAKVTEEGKKTLSDLGEVLKGYRNKIEIRGHAAERPRPADWTDQDSLDLSYRRASFVANELILSGIDSRRIVLTAVGANEPVARGVYDPALLANNRRVEIIVRESLIDDYLGDSPISSTLLEAPESSTTSTTAPAPLLEVGSNGDTQPTGGDEQP